MKSKSVYLLSFAAGVVVLMFLPALVMAGIRSAGFCPYTHEKHLLVTQWVQVVWMAGCVQFMWLKLIRKNRDVIRMVA